MQIGKHGLDLIKAFEKLMLEAYLDQAGIPTIGWGHIRGVKLGDKIDVALATEYLIADLAEAERAVNARVNRILSQDQYDALVSFEFNTGAFVKGTATIIRLVNARKDDDVPAEMAKWCLVTDPRTKERVKSRGLMRRRDLEAKLWLQGTQMPLSAAEGDGIAHPTMTASEVGVAVPADPNGGSGTVPVHVDPKPVAHSPAVLATSLVSLAGVLQSSADKVQPLLAYSEHLKVAFLALAVGAIVATAIHAWVTR